MFDKKRGSVVYNVEVKGVLNLEPISVPEGQRQLFLDDHGIAKLENLRRTIHQPVKRGAVLKPDRPWETVLQIRCAPAWDESKQIFKLWVVTFASIAGYPIAGSTYAESKDGINWTKPILRQYEYQGSRENNFVTPDPKLNWPANAIMSVVYDPDDPDPNRRFKGFAGAKDRKPIVSSDGIDWKFLEVSSLPSQDESNLSYDRLARTFVATLKTSGPYGRSHGIWTSKDFNSWTKLEVLFHADKLDQELGRKNIEKCFADSKRNHPEYNIPSTHNVDVYNMGVFRYEGLYLGMPAMFHQTGRVSKDWQGFDKMGLADEILKEVRTSGDWSGFHHVQLACSRDLLNWTRLGERQPFLDLSPVAGGAYDTQVILPPSTALVRGDELWFYYTGIRSYAIISGGKRDLGGAICLAVLRRDGFMSLDAQKEPGTLLTKPFVVNWTKLSVNVDAREGTLEVSVLDGAGKTVAVSEPIVGNKLRATVQWKSGDLASHEGRPMSLRFILRNAQFYSFWCDK